MSLFDGVISLNDAEVPVIVGLEETGIRMSSGGSEIGEWPVGEFSIDHDGQGVFTITAENESLRFIPNEPTSFAAGLRMEETPVNEAVVPEHEPDPIHEQPAAADDDVPEPRTITKLVFYAVAAGTAVMGMWALLSLF